MNRGQQHNARYRRDNYRHFVNRKLPFEERACTSKVPFVTREEARSLARHGRFQDGRLVPYRCPIGDHWHLGHRSSKAASAARRRGRLEGVGVLDGFEGLEVADELRREAKDHRGFPFARVAHLRLARAQRGDARGVGEVPIRGDEQEEN